VNPALRVIQRSVLLALALTGLVGTASAYTFFVHYATASGSYTPIPERYDLSALNNNTLYYYVSSSGPAKMAPGDSFPALLSQIQLAGQAWNGVSSSSLRLAYGGLFAADAAQATPHVEVVFEELPPGLLAMTGLTTPNRSRERLWRPLRAHTALDRYPISRPFRAAELRQFSQRPSADRGP